MSSLVSIICPVYNASKYLSECVFSVLNQSSADWELILIDDGSTDDSGFICDGFAKKDNRIKVLHRCNSGQMKARLDGIKNANGDFIMFLDSDDLLNKDTIENILNYILSNTNVDAYIFNAETFPKKENSKTLPVVEEEKTFRTNADIIKFTFGNQMFGYLWMYCFNKKMLLKAIDKLNPFIDVRYTEDGAFIYDVMSICKSIKTISLSLYYYRDNDASITHNLTEKDRIDRYYVFEYIYSNIYKLQKDFKPSHEISSMVSWAVFSMLIHIKNKILFKKMFKEARKSTILKKISNNVLTKNRQFNLCRLLLKMNLPYIFYKYSHK